MNLDMANASLQHASAYLIAVGTTLGGGAAAAAPATAVGQGGLVVGTAGLTGLLILLARETAPPLFKSFTDAINNREARIRTAERFERLTIENAEIKAENAKLKEKLEELDAKADAATVAAAVAVAQNEALKQEISKVRHDARGTTQRMNIADERIDQVERIVGGSGDRDPESAL